MNELELLLIGVALGAVPTAQLGQLMLAGLGKWAGISPREINQFQQATEGGDGDGDA